MGASVLHEDAIFPVRKAGIPINIKNTNAPQDKGTLIVEATCCQPKYTITGIAGTDGFAAITIEKAMMNSAIIATGGKQYKVAEGDVIKVEKLAAEAGSEVTFDDVILVSTDSDVKCGDAVANASVTASVVGEGKSKKVIVYKYKRKTGYHKKNGHRQSYTKVEIKKINA